MSKDPSDVEPSYVSRGGTKLAFALHRFQLDPAGWVCADLGCNVGGFTDCLLQRGAGRVYAVDTGYGTLAWKLRKDPRVVVMERTNALHVELPEPVDLVTIDAGWTRQHVILPAARKLLAPDGRIVALIKPHYEAQRSQLNRGVLADENADDVCREVLDRIAASGWKIDAQVESCIRGQKGNREFLALLSQPRTG